MKIFVDADACPVKEAIVKTAKKYGLPVIMVIDTSHEYNDGYSQVVVVSKGSDAADFMLVNMTGLGDVVVTQDYGVAAMALSKGSMVLDQNGMIYNENNIDGLLMGRHMNKKLRSAGGRTKGPSRRVKSQDVDFEKSLINLILLHTG
jgi:uncharacterized protein YaiI (UPF0178 family)